MKLQNSVLLLLFIYFYYNSVTTFHQETSTISKPDSFGDGGREQKGKKIPRNIPGWLARLAVIHSDSKK